MTSCDGVDKDCVVLRNCPGSTSTDDDTPTVAKALVASNMRSMKCPGLLSNRTSNIVAVITAIMPSVMIVNDRLITSPGMRRPIIST